MPPSDRQPPDRIDGDDAMQDPEHGSGGQDGELIRYLDDQLDGRARADLGARLTATGATATAERLAALRGRSAHLSGLLAADAALGELTRASADAMRPHIIQAARRGQRRRSTRLLRAAAAVLLLAGLIGTASPVRAWLLLRVQTVARALGIVGEPAGRAPAASPMSDAVDAAVRVSFPVRSAALDVAVLVEGGTLIVRRGTGTAGIAEATGTSDVRFVVLPDGVRIESSGQPAGAVYVLTLPAHVSSIRVLASDGTMTVHALPAGSDVLTVELNE